MSDAATHWLDDEPERPRSTRRVSLLVAAAVLPWLVIAVLLLRDPASAAGTGNPASSAAAIDVADLAPGVDPLVGAGTGASDDPRDAPTGATDAADATDATDATDAGRVRVDDPFTDVATADDVPTSLPHAGSVPTLPDLPGVTRISHGAAESLALALTRAWLADTGPELTGADLPVEPRGYLEHASVERIDLAAADSAVATVTVVLLERSGDAYVEALLRRVAVPLTLTETTVHPGGTPWWLPRAPDLTPVPPELTPLEDAAVTRAVLEALTRAGYRDVTVTSLATTPGGTYVAEVTATTPDGELVASPVWLRPTPDGAEVLGHRTDATV